MLPRVLPFAAYMGFVAIESLLTADMISRLGNFTIWFYPIKTIVVLSLLVMNWGAYDELRGRPFSGPGDVVLAVGVGLAVYVAWIQMDWSWATQGEVAGYNPFAASPSAGFILAGIRVMGAALVVPVMEELFWRSFIIRYIVSSDFASVPIGKLTRASFLISIILFGVEHNLWLAGMMAGVAYTLILYKTKRLWPCILAHGITNFALGIHVLATGEWRWW